MSLTRPFAFTGCAVLAASFLLFSVKSVALSAVTAAVSLIALVILFVFRRKKERLFVYALALLLVFLAAFSSALTERLLIKPAFDLVGKDRRIVAVVTDYPVKIGSRYYVDTKLKSESSSLGLNCRLSFSKDDYFLYLEDGSIGDKLSFKGTVYKLGRNDPTSESNFLSQCKVIGAYPTGFVTVFEKAEKVPFSFIKEIRRSIKERIAKDFDGAYSGIGIAALLGDKSGIDSEVYEKMKTAGVSHILAVSGLHLSIWILFFDRLFSSLGFDKKKYSFALILFVLFAMLLAGLSPSVCRAGVTMIPYLLFYALYRRGDPLNSLGMAVTLILIIRPSMSVSIGFLLSVFASAGIIGFSLPVCAFFKKRFNLRSDRAIRAADAAVSVPLVSFGAWFFTLPLTVWYFGGISTYSVLTNALVYIFTAPMVTCFGLYTVFSFVPLFSSVFKLIAKSCSFLIIGISKFVSGLPFSYLNVTAFSVYAFTALFIGTVTSAALMKKYRNKTVTLMGFGIILALTVFFVLTLLSGNIDLRQTA